MNEGWLVPANPTRLDDDGTTEPPVARQRQRRRVRRSASHPEAGDHDHDHDVIAGLLDSMPDPQTIELQGMIRTSAAMPKGTSYDPWRTYTRATNDHDHDVKLRISVPKGIAALLNEAAEKYPGYRNQADVLRDAAVHRLWWLAEHHEELVGLRSIDDWAVQMAVEMEHERVVQRARNLEQARDVLAKVETMGDWKTYAVIVERYGEYAAGLDEPWASKMTQVVGEARMKLAQQGG